MAELFISYAREQSEFAARLSERLRDDGREIWIDHEDIEPAAEWRDRIQDGIDAASSMLFVISPDSLASVECRKEIDRAVAGGKRIIPILAVDPSEATPPGPVSDLNWIRLRAADDWDAGLADLATAIDTDLDWSYFHARVLVRATEWDASGRAGGALLRGHDLVEAEAEFGRSRDEGQARATELQREYIVASRQARTRFLQRIIGAAGIALAAVVALAVVAFIQRSIAVEARDEARTEAAISRAGELAARANGAVDPYEAIVLAVESAQEVEVPASRDAIARAAQRAFELPAARAYGPLLGHRDFVGDLAFSNEPGLILTAGRDGELITWDTTNGQPTGARFELGADVTALAFAPGDALVAVASGDGAIQLFSRDLSLADPGFVAASRVIDLNWSADGALLSAVTRNGVIETWDRTDSGAVSTVALEPVDGLWELAFSPSGDRIAGATFDGSVVVWDSATGAQEFSATFAHPQIIYSVAWAPDGSAFATSSLDKSVSIVDASTGASIMPPTLGHAEGVVFVDWSPDGSRLASSSFDGTVRLWDVDAGVPLGLPLPGHDNTVSVVRWSPGGEFVASGSDDRTAIVWDATVMADLGDPLSADESVRAVAWLSDETFLAPNDSGALTRRDAVTGEVINEWQLDALRPPSAIAVSADESRVALIDLSGLVEVWSVSGEFVDSIDLGSGIESNQIDRVQPGDVTWSPAGTAVAAGIDRALAIWRPGGGDPLVIEDAHEGWIHAVAWSRDGEVLASGGADRVVKLWDPETGDAIRDPLSFHIDTVFALRWSPDGTILASGSQDKTAMLWSTEDWQPVGPELRGHLGWILDLAWSPDGRTIASSSPDRGVRLWDVQSSMQLGAPLVGHQGFVQSVDWSPDGTRLVSGDDFGSLRLWESVSERWLCEFASAALGEAGVNAIDISADARVCVADPPREIDSGPLPVIPVSFD